MTTLALAPNPVRERALEHFREHRLYERQHAPGDALWKACESLAAAELARDAFVLALQQLRVMGSLGTRREECIDALLSAHGFGTRPGEEGSLAFGFDPKGAA